MKEPVHSFSGEVKSTDLSVLESVFEGIDFKTKPREHQTRATFIGIAETSWLFALDMGLGKTKIALDIHTMRNKLDGKGKMLVLCPSIMINTWRYEAQKHSEHTVQLIESKLSASEKVETFFSADADIVVCSITWITQKLNGLKSNSRESKKFIETFASFDRLVIDEGHKIMNPTSAGFKVTRKYLLDIRCRYILTGTPVSNNPTGIWALYYILDKGATFGDDFHSFANKYFRVEMTYHRFPKYFLLDRTKEAFYAAFWSRAIRWTEDDCSDLPEKEYIKLGLDMTPKQNADYDNELEVGGNLQRLLRITGGSGYKDNPKIEALRELLQELVLDGNKQIIVWAWLVAENEAIMMLCAKMKINATSIRGGVSPDAKDAAIESWRQGKIRVIAANQKSLGVGVTLTESHTCIFYSNNSSLTDRKQSEKRIHRTGQTIRCTYIDLICRKSADIKIVQILDAASTRFEDMLDDKIIIDHAELLAQRKRKK